MWFTVLGPLAAGGAGGEVAAGPPKQRTLLAALLLNANTPMTAGQLRASIWGADPPASATKNLQLYVARLRRALAAAEPGPRLDTVGRGYRLRTTAGELDLDDFRRLTAEARDRRRAGDTEAALTAYDRAVRLWRGPPLAGLTPAPALEGEVAALIEAYLVLCQERFHLLLACGRPGEAVPGLRRLVGAHPQRESLRYLLMLALTGIGDRVAALAAYRQCYRSFGSRWGIEPGPELRRLHSAILTGDARPMSLLPGSLLTDAAPSAAARTRAE